MSEGSAGKWRILVVDDSDLVREMIRGALAERGYRVTTACGGAEAIRSARENPPDLVLLDLMMPELSGHAVCRVFKIDDRLSRIPIIFLTSVGESTQEVKAFELGAVDYVTKPVRPEVLLARVSTHLQLAQFQRDIERGAHFSGALAAAEVIVLELEGPLAELLAASRTLELAKDRLDAEAREAASAVSALAERIEAILEKVSKSIQVSGDSAAKKV